MHRLICILMCLACLTAVSAQSETKTEVYIKGDTIVVRSLTIDEVATTEAQVDGVVKSLNEAIAKTEAQLAGMRKQLADMHRVQALVADRTKSLQTLKAEQAPVPASLDSKSNK
jgi:phage shock protein A